MATPRRQNRNVMILLRIGVTVLCGIALFSVIDPADIWRYISRIPGESLVTALLLHVLIILLLGWRWQTILKMLGTDCRLMPAVDMTFMATFFNLVLPFSIGGDIYRIWLGRRVGININDTVPGTVLDRLTGLLALGLMLLLTAGLLPTSALPWELRGLMIALLPMLLISLWLFFALVPPRENKQGVGQRLAVMSQKLRAACGKQGNMLTILLQSLVAHLLAVGTVIAIAAGLGLDLNIADALLLVPVMLLAIMLPISVGGWGLREAAAIPLLALADIPASGAVALALLFGLTQIAAGGVGALYFFWTTSNRRQRA